VNRDEEETFVKLAIDKGFYIAVREFNVPKSEWNRMQDVVSSYYYKLKG
jgi:hypothetical protein